MAKVKNELILTGLVLAALLYSMPLQAETMESISINEETALPAPEITAIQLEQQDPPDIQTGYLSTQEKKSTGKGKSILNVSKAKPASFASSLETPKTAASVRSLGWKQKTLQTPQPLSSLIKEVPKEIEEKRAKLLKKGKIKNISNDAYKPNIK